MDCDMKPWNELVKLENFAIENSGSDDRYYLVINETGEIRGFEFYKHPGTPEMQRIRALRRLCDFLLSKDQREKLI